ncbi:hypothetical protein EHS25_007925 [Saitozyma podzolica]|uniref:Major facilitator superfamily (MFS) profile domain-containing protein n=1 Tax=Saitozyma podzolica TaxID=1890683 RepID=A0A427YR66_9TREE|nr:hypothetical protein EHS25_007925 [Saitozyma podzolica]
MSTEEVINVSKEDGYSDRQVVTVHPNLLALASAYTPGSEAEKALVRKIDRRIVPCIWILYTMSYLDRANIGNAKTGGLQADFNLTSTQYSVVLLVFFISYVLFEIPSNLLLTRIRPSLYLSGLCVIWGGVAAAMAATSNWQQLAGVRFALGVIEAGFAPGVAFYLSSWYKRYELASRFSIYYTATAVSGAFSGLLAGVITQHLNGERGLQGWQWLFLIEGVASSFVGLWTWFIMPDYPSTTKWLSEEEQILAAQRLAHDGLANTVGAQGHMGHYEAIKAVFSDWRVYLFIFIFMLVTGSQTIQYFVPTLVGALGWTSWDGQYHTIPVYACAFVFILGFAFTSDQFENKPLFISMAAGLGTICFIATVASTNHTVQYVFLVFGFGSVYAIAPLTLTWVANIICFPAEKRAVAIALVNALGNSASIYGVFLWPATDAPRYIPGFTATTVWVFTMCVLAQIMAYLFKKYPLVAPNPEEVVAQELEKQRRLATSNI